MTTEVEQRSIPAEQAERDPCSQDETADGVHCPWRHLSQSALEEYNAAAATEPKAAATGLSGLLGLSNHGADVRQAARLNFTVTALDYAQQQRFQPEQAGVIFNVCQTLLEACARDMSCTEAQQVLRDATIPLTRRSPAPGSPHFSADDVASVASFFASGFLQHYRLYQFVLTQPRPSEDTQLEEHVELPYAVGFHGLVLTEEEWGAKQAADASAQAAATEAERAAHNAAVAAAAQAQQEAQAAEAEAERQRRLKLKPATLEEAVEMAVAARVEMERAPLQAACAAELASLRAELAALKPSPVFGKGQK